MADEQSTLAPSGLHVASRREFLAAGTAGLTAGIASAGIAACSAPAAQPAPASGRVLLRGGCVLSLDPKVGDFEAADVLIDGARIA